MACFNTFNMVSGKECSIMIKGEKRRQFLMRSYGLWLFGKSCVPAVLSFHHTFVPVIIVCATFCSYFYHWMRGKNSLVSLGPMAKFSPAFIPRKEFGRAVNVIVLQSKFGGPEFKSRPCPDLFTKSQDFLKKSSITQNIQTANCFASDQLDS